METNTLTREAIIVHLDTPVCGILAGVRIHVQTISLRAMWQLCYALKCDSAEELIAEMWKMIKKRKETK